MITFEDSKNELNQIISVVFSMFGEKPGTSLLHLVSI